MEAQVDEIIPGPTAELLFNKKCRGKKPRPWWKFWGKKKIHSTSITGFEFRNDFEMFPSSKIFTGKIKLHRSLTRFIEKMIDEYETCDGYVKSRGYNTDLATKDEQDFPIAYENVIILKLKKMHGPCSMDLFYPCYNIMDKVDCCSFSFWPVGTSHTFDVAATGTIIHMKFISYLNTPQSKNVL